MPIKKVDGGYQWGKHGKVYKKRSDAVKQAQAAYASGFEEKKEKEKAKDDGELNKAANAENALAPTIEEQNEALNLDDSEKRAKAVKKILDTYCHDEVQLNRASMRTYDNDGRLHVTMNPISKSNICGYYGSEIPSSETLGLDADKEYMLLRSPDELKKGAPTFNGVQLIGWQHRKVDVDNPQKEHIVGCTGTDAEFKNDYLYNTLTFWDSKAIDDIESDRVKELSCAYSYQLDMTPGEYNGEKYDGVMRNIVGNHVALVEKGRVGHDVYVQDSHPEIGENQVDRDKSKEKAEDAEHRDYMDEARTRLRGLVGDDIEEEKINEILEELREGFGQNREAHSEIEHDLGRDESDKEREIQEGRTEVREELKEKGLKVRGADESMEGKENRREGREEEKEDLERKIKHAVDAALEHERKRSEDMRRARDAVVPVAGEVACDSAYGYWEAGLNALGINPSNFPESHWESIYKSHSNRTTSKDVFGSFASDSSATKSTSMIEKLHGKI